MYEEAPTATYPMDSVAKEIEQPAIIMSGVNKTFVQWQRDHNLKNVIRNLVKPARKEIEALKNISFFVNKGDFVAYAGPNGAGKSTTMKLLSGMLVPDSGHIEVLGLSPQNQRIELMKSLGVLFGNRTELWWDHPISQSFAWKKTVWSIPEDVYKKNLALLIELLDIQPLLKTFARELSLGQRMRADLALMLLHDPQIILLDEPTLGLDVLAKRRMISFLKELNREKQVTIMVTSHDMDDLEEMAGRMLMISEGQLAFDGSFDALREVGGNISKVFVTVNEGTLLNLKEFPNFKQNGLTYEFELDSKVTPLNLLLSSLAQIDGIKDLEIKKAPIEEVIARLYQSWSH